MNKIICFSASSKEAYNNFINTTTKPIKDELISEQITSKCDEDYFLWAMRYSKKNESLWKKINKGDYALFYRNKKFIGYGEILGTFLSEELASKYYNNIIYKLIIVLKSVKVMEFSREKMWKLFKYSDVARIQGMMIPNLVVQKQLLNEHNNIANLINHILDLQENIS
ncbi:hypothetical protein [Pallidibacillus pasinlerensis]|uniref:EVE domain-containing protein n=1 Tax=Pallidibacillus pasinlerensis TaxID=2703818 RepID=A0ABX0AD30_9BACI|nr:hypothetical protein [Pallidibacillus pasinlerensis]NCU19058.1 hypothetical protein [Pallidibacillus pasinlerensis]